MNGRSVTVNGIVGQGGCEAEPVWERPWTLDEIHKASGSWSLGADAGLLLFLQEFSQRMLSRTHEIEKQLDGLVQHTKATDSRLHNVFNDFLMLSNIQFIENRVYDEEVEEAAKPESGGKPVEPERTREQKEAELIPKVQEAVRHGLRVLESAFERLDIKAGNSDSEDEETNERVEHLLEPKDLYIDRPLPYIIGSQQFMEEEDVGLGDLSSEESVGSERGSVIESEEEKEESGDDTVDESEDDEEQKPPKLVHKQQLISDEDEDDDSDLFHQSEKEDDGGDLPSTRKVGQSSFAEELAARIQVESPKAQDDERAPLSSGGAAKKSRMKAKKETPKARRQGEREHSEQKVLTERCGVILDAELSVRPQAEEDENLFAPEDADEDDDYSPFRGKSGLFSGGKGLFDDDEGDLFAEDPKEDLDKGKEVQGVVSNEPPARKSGKKVPVGAVSIYPGGDLFRTSVIPERVRDKQAREKVTDAPASPVREPMDVGGLFDVEDDDLFGSSVKTVTSATAEPKLAASFFDDSEDSGLFETSVTPKPATEKARGQRSAEPHPEAVESSPRLAEKSQTSSGLFSDDDEPQDLFSSNKDTKRHQSKQSLDPSRSNPIPVSFFDDDEGDLFSSALTKDPAAGKKPPQPKPLTSESKSAALFVSEEQVRNCALIFQLGSDGASTQEGESPSRPSVTGLPKESPSNLNSVLSLFDDDENLEDELNQSSLVNDDKLPQSGVSTRVFQDEELLFSQHQQKDNDPDVDLFVDALKPEVDKTGMKPPVNSTPASQTRPVEPPSSDLFDGVDNLFSASKAGSAKPQSFAASIFEDSVDEDLFMVAPKKPPVVQKKPVLKGTGITASKTSEHPKGARGKVLNKPRPEKEKPTNAGPVKTKGPSSRIGRLQANLAINPASLLPGASPKVAVVRPGSASPSPSPPSPEVTPPAFGPLAAAGEGGGVSFEEPMQTGILPSVNKSRARVGQKRRPPTRVARRLAAQQSDETEDLDQSSEVDGVSGVADLSPTALVQKPNPDKPPLAKWAPSPEPSTGDATGPPSATIAKLPARSDLFGSDDLFSPSSVEEPPRAVGQWEDALPKEDPSQSIFSPSEDDLFKSSKRTTKKPKPAAFLEEEGSDDLFGIAKLGKTKPTAQKTLDIFEDDLFSTESVTLTKKSNEGSIDVDLFDDHVDIFADLKVAPKERNKKKIETKSIFDDDMDDIFAPAKPAASSKKQSKPKIKSKQAALPASAPDSKAVDIFDDPLNAFGP
ncbi:WASH complex subunit 2 [Scyliorhinus canicula]|uniref:WASH complex subunit 2 n=1 Tax=Scyliorhinus canicula TaxID=7830 RepID=UPI0018F7258A|nr:WASH complex subunit 2 [Scyliorhinus canicula]